ncbi:MAG: ABC transporter ATP-binding protein [Clostridia bacterium]|nr:ABC transporter ATP-binding protein [Clostridia bacterium]
MERGKVLIEAKHLVKTYGEGEGLMHALDDVSINVYEREFLAIIGGSGSGKSTFLNMVGGIDKVDSGEILVYGEDIVKFSDKKLTLYRRDTVGFIYQFFNLINDITVYQNVVLAPGSRNKERAYSLLERVELKGKENKFPRQLSGGQQQRVAIARALNKPSEILLCDEPTGALDDSSGKAVLKLLEEIHNEGKTIVLVTHTREIAGMADRVITMKNGRVIDEKINEHKLKAEEVDW